LTSRLKLVEKQVENLEELCLGLNQPEKIENSLSGAMLSFAHFILAKKKFKKNNVNP
jgi:hypothetical protein